MTTSQTTSQTTTSDTTREPLTIVQSVPERLFRVEEVVQEGTLVTATMPTGPWLERDGGRVTLGSLGVLADDVLGYGVMVDRPAEHWSVSSEISIDLCHPVEVGTTLLGSARPLYSDLRGGLASGEIVDDRGRLVAVGRQHGRFVPGMPAAATQAIPVAEPTAGRLDATAVAELLAATPRLTDGGAVLDLVVSQDLVNPLGNLHGGITICLADLVAVTAMEGGGQSLDTASIHVAYVRPIPLGTSVTFTATVVHGGRTFAVARIDARNPDGKVCASGTVTAGLA